MGCANCQTSEKGSCSPGCGNNGTCGTLACNKLSTYDWLNHMAMPSDYKPFDIVEIRFKGSRKEYYRNSENLELYLGDLVVVQANFGHDVGEVSLSGELVRLQLKKNRIDPNDQNIGKIYRKATDRDAEKYKEFKSKEVNDLETARTIAMSLKLSLKMSDIEYQGDGRKVIFFYTAESRVDFRELIKRYASEFKTRIEMRQVSYREEASRLGGLGSCGRELCCSTWLTDYKVVSMNTAKIQNLSINMLKLSGQCGRLKCCLNYELETYLEALREYPNTENLKLVTQQGPAYHQKTDILKRVMWFSYPKSSDWVVLELDRVNEIVALNKKGEKPEALKVVPDFVPDLGYVEPAADLISDQSITRLDHKDAERNKKKKGFRKGKGKYKGKNPQGRNTQNKNTQNKNRPNKKRPNQASGTAQSNNPNKGQKPAMKKPSRRKDNRPTKTNKKEA